MILPPKTKALMLIENLVVFSKEKIAPYKHRKWQKKEISEEERFFEAYAWKLSKIACWPPDFDLILLWPKS